MGDFQNIIPLIRQKSTENSVQRTMLIVCLALVPGILVSVLILGIGVIANIVLAMLSILFLEILFHRLAGHAVLTFPFDGSGAVMGLILALSLPPDLPWWMVLIGSSSAAILGKIIFGGLGQNAFNPAMVGVAILLVSFPMEMNNWLLVIDSESGPTPLDSLHTGLRLSYTVSELATTDNGRIFGLLGGSNLEWINLAFLLGGLCLMYLKIIKWPIPLGVIAGIVISAGLLHGVDGDLYPSTLFHLLGGASMLCAFFVATDPVSSPVTPRAKLVYGFCVGMLVVMIRTWGTYPEGVAFAVLIMNAAAPVLDYYLRPKLADVKLKAKQE